MKFGFGAVLDVLAAVHGIDADRMGAFKGRLKHYRQAGLLRAAGPSAGPGRHSQYEEEDIFRLAFCLQLSEIGIDPQVIARFVAVRWGGALREDVAGHGSTAAAARRATNRERQEAWNASADRKPAPKTRETRYFLTKPAQIGRWNEGLFSSQVFDGTDLKNSLDVLTSSSINCALINLTQLRAQVQAEIARVIEEEAKKPPGVPRRGRRKRLVVAP